MAQPHTFTTNYDLLKIGLGSNAFNNPYHILYSQTMDKIDTELFKAETFRTALDGTGYGFVNHAGAGAFVAAKPLRLHQQAGWHTNNSVQVSSDAGQSPFALDLIDATYVGVVAAMRIALFPVITGKPLPLSRFGLFVTTSGVSRGFSIIAYSSNAAGRPADLLDRSSLVTGSPPDYFLPAGLQVCTAGDMPILESLPPGLLVWVGFTQHGEGGDLPCKGLQTARGCGYTVDGDPISGVQMLFSSPTPPTTWPEDEDNDPTIFPWTEATPFIFRTT